MAPSRFPPIAAQHEAEDFRLEFLVPDDALLPVFFDSPLARHQVFEALPTLLRKTPQAAVLYPNGDVIAATYRGSQPKNGWKVIAHYPPFVVDQVTPRGMLELTGFDLVALADSVRLLQKDGTAWFLKDRWGRDEPDQPATTEEQAESGWRGARQRSGP
jgi:hypothetical protein